MTSQHLGMFFLETTARVYVAHSDIRRVNSHQTSIIGLVVEFIVAIDEARVRFTDDARMFFFAHIFSGSIILFILLFSCHL